MDALETYRDALQQVLTEYAHFLSTDDISTCELVFDRQRDHYLLVEVGWENGGRNYGALIHADIIDGKIWVQHDGTEEGIAGELTAAGVPKEAIVLAFRPPSMRKLTEFAIA